MKRVLYNLSKIRKLSLLLDNRVIFAAVTIALVSLLFLILFILFNLRPGSEIVAVHYNVLIGVDVVKSGWYVLQLPLIGFVVMILNIFLLRKFFRFEPYAAVILSLGAAIVSVILLISGITLKNLY